MTGIFKFILSTWSVAQILNSIPVIGQQQRPTARDRTKATTRSIVDTIIRTNSQHNNRTYD